MLNIDIVEGCNNKCFFCDARNVKKIKYMKDELFYHIVKECKEIGIEEINLIPLGEPFLHKSIYSFLSFLDNNNFTYLIFTNLLVVDIPRLSSMKLKKLHLNVSHYGDNESEFIYHTKTNKQQYELYLKQLQLLKQGNIQYTIHDRTEKNYHFDYKDSIERNIKNFNGNCDHIFHPKVNCDGQITFCNFINSNIDAPIFFSKLTDICDLKEVLTLKDRYAFFKYSHYCEQFCNNYETKCGNKTTIIDLKLFHESKKNYYKELNFE